MLPAARGLGLCQTLAGPLPILLELASPLPGDAREVRASKPPCPSSSRPTLPTILGPTAWPR